MGNIQKVAQQLEAGQRELSEWLETERTSLLALHGEKTEIEAKREAGEQYGLRRLIEIERSIAAQENVISRLEADLQAVKDRHSPDVIGPQLRRAADADKAELLASVKADYTKAVKSLEAALDAIDAINAKIEPTIRENDAAFREIAKYVPDSSGRAADLIRREYRPLTISLNEINATLLRLHTRCGEGKFNGALTAPEWNDIKRKYGIEGRS